MPKYAVKLGDIFLEADEPISKEQREQAIKMLKGEEPMTDEPKGAKIVKRFG